MVSVLITGATGFIAQHIIKLLVEKGYSVIGTVRSTEKGDHLKKLFGEKFSYEVVGDLEDPTAFDDVFKTHQEVTVVLHTASPVAFQVEDIERDLLNPAIQGVTGILKEIKLHAPQVTRVVLTASYVSLVSRGGDFDPKVTVNEESWNDITWEQSKENGVAGYYGSKTFAEKAAWDFVKKEKPNFALTTIHPGYVFGPQAFDESVGENLNLSAEVINSLLKLGPKDEIPPSDGCCVDVRDVAKAHYIGFTKDKAKGQRLITISSRISSQVILDILHSEFPQLAGKVPIGKPGFRSKAVTDASVLDDINSKDILGYKFITLEKTIYDTAKQILHVRK